MGVHLAFGPFTFDCDERTLRRDGRSVPLAPKVADALALLLAEPGALVGKDALRDALWPDGFVEDGNLTQTIYLIRRALDPEGDGRTFVETVPRRGYRFARPVDVLAAQRSEPRLRRTGLAFAARALAFSLLVIALGGVSIGGVSSHAAPAFTGEAARAYTLAWYMWNRRTEAGARSSIAHFRRVVELKPNDARGYAGLAEVYGVVGSWEFRAIAPPVRAYRLSEEYARQALRRDPHSGEAFTSLGSVALQRDLDLDRAESDLRTAIAYSPDYSHAYESLGITRLYRGDAEGARRLLARSIELDPLSPMNLMWYGKSLYYGRRFAEARTTLRQLADFDANSHGAMEMLALVDIELGRNDEARSAIAKMRGAAPKKRAYVDMLDAFLNARSGRAVIASSNLKPRRSAHVDVATAMAVCLALGRRDDALRWVDIALHDPQLRQERGMYRIDPRLTALRNDGRFQALVARSG